MSVQTHGVRGRPLLRAIAVGLAIVVPVSAGVVALDRNVDDFDTSVWMWLPVVAIVAAYVAAGVVAGRGAPHAPLLHGAVAAVGTFAGWLAVRVAVPLAQGDDLGFGLRTVLVNALLAVGFGMLGAAFTRAAERGL